MRNLSQKYLIEMAIYWKKNENVKKVRKKEEKQGGREREDQENIKNNAKIIDNR